MPLKFAGQLLGNVSRAGFVMASLLGQPAMSLPLIDMTPAQMTAQGLVHERSGVAYQYDNTGKLTTNPHNLYPNSNDVVASWTAQNATITPNATTGPVGPAALVDIPAGAGTNRLLKFDNTGVGGWRILSFYVKAAGQNTITLHQITGTPGTVTIDLSNGTATGQTSNLVVQPVSGWPGWYRISYRGSATNPSGNGVYYQITSASPQNFYMSGTMLEVVTYQTVAREYIATGASAYFGVRQDYHPVTLQPRGVLLEALASTNLLPNSIPQSTADTWPASSGTITLNNSVGPDGLTNMARFLEAASTSAHGAYMNGNPAIVTAGTVYCASIYVKPTLGRTKFRITAGNGSIASGGYQDYDLATGQKIGAPVAIGTGQVWDVNKAVPVGNGIWRVSVTASVPTTSMYIVVQTLDDAGNATFLGDPAKGFYYGYGQVEAQWYPSSYIPTFGLTVTRSADNVYQTGSNFSSWFNPTEGTFICHAESMLGSWVSDNPAPFVLVGSGNPGFSDRFGPMMDRGSYQVMGGMRWNTAGGGIDIPLSPPVYEVDSFVPFKMAWAYKDGDTGGAINGYAGDSTAAYNGAINLQRLNIGTGGGAYAVTYFAGWVRKIEYHNYRVPTSLLRYESL